MDSIRNERRRKLAAAAMAELIGKAMRSTLAGDYSKWIAEMSWEIADAMAEQEDARFERGRDAQS